MGLALFWTIVGVAYLWSQSANDGERYGGDFVVFWSAANIAKGGHPEKVFDFETLHTEERKLVPDTGLYPWHYPPQFLLIVRPFAALPYCAALVLWSALGIAAIAGTVWLCGGRTVGVLGLPLMALATNVSFGQNGMFTGAILGAGLTLLSSRPFAAGAVLGLLSYKPHFAPVAIFALLLMKNWRALAGVAVSGMLFAVASLVIFGIDIWGEFLANSSFAAETLYLPGAWEKMPGITSALMLAGAPKVVAQIGQAIWAVGLLAVVAGLVRSKARPDLRNSGIVVATLAASPYVFVYDLAALAVVYAWILRDSRGHGMNLWERVGLGISCCAPVGAWAIADLTSIQVGPLVLLSLMAIVCWRAWSSRAVETHGTVSPINANFVRTMYQSRTLGSLPSDKPVTNR